MRSKIIIGITVIIAIILAITLIPETKAQAPIGCCCDPILFNGSWQTPADCSTLGFVYVGPPAAYGITCSDHCNATLAPAPGAVCGDNICQAREDSNNCPADCAPIVAGCGSPGYKPAPTNFNVNPIKGKKQLKLTFALPCPADFVNISRCKGTDCTNFAQIAQAPATTVFTDEDNDLQFNSDYTYAVSAYYGIAGQSDPITAIGNPGDIECWEKQTNKFCVNDFTYEQYADYLQLYGYANELATAFQQAFTTTTKRVFATRLNKAWQCNDLNRLIDTAPRVECNTQQQEYCISDENGPRCAKKEPCNTGFDPFGLYTTQQNCEGLIPQKYCFFDKSTTTTNKCYSCDPKMTCYDYRSKGACQKDNCGAGDCQWNDIIPDLGVGVCIDKQYNNCKLCNKNGTTGMENLNVFNTIFDACREEKSNAMSTILYPCFYDKDRKVSKTCGEATCADYSQIQCNAPQLGVKLNPDNSVAQGSTDVCGIGVCEYNINTGCIKNADGNTGAGFQDCSYGNLTCEQDHYPPTTTLMPTGAAGRVDKLLIRIFDKINNTSPPLDYAGKSGYRTYICVQNATTNCADARTFGISTTKKELILKNGQLKEGNKTLATLDIGDNVITFYSRDAANNLEVLKDVNVYACDKCNGPTLLNLTVTGGRIIGNKIYTSAKKPTFTYTFDEPTQMTFGDISRAGESISLTQLTAGMTTTHTFEPVTELLGTYAITVNGHNDQNVYFDAPGLRYDLIIDPNIAGLNITPEDGSVTNKTLIDITLTFSTPATLNKVILGHDNFANPYTQQTVDRDITNLFKSNDNLTYTAKADKITGGMYVITVDATGYNGLNVYKQSTFFNAATKPSIRLLQPSWGVTAYSVFNASVMTPLPAECTYVFNTPTAPASTEYKLYNPFSGLDKIHTTSGLNLPYGIDSAAPLHVYCEYADFGIVQRTFDVMLDPDTPTIIKAFAEPAIIAEPYIPGQELYATTIKVQMNKEGFCKYSPITSNFGVMTGVFPGFDRIPKTSHAADINVTTKQTYEYWVTCKGKNELLTAPAKVSFTIDTNLPLNVTSSTPQGFGQLNFTLGVVANKRVMCYFGEQQDDTTVCMGACSPAYTQAQNIRAGNAGEYTYYVKCAHVSGENSEILEIPVIIDTTPPEMNYVNDDSSLIEEPEITWSHNKIRAAYSADDEESGISHYLVTLKEGTGNKIIVKDLVMNNTDGQPIYITQTQNGSPFRLVNGKQYIFQVKAVNKVGLESEIMESDGVTLDVTRTPEPCMDGEQNNDETDVDCGGECSGCEENKKCSTDLDCETNYCQDNICKVASCEDGVINGLESDVDCGGQACDKCENDRKCIRHSDCSTDYCNLQTSMCTDAPPCADKTLSDGETDIDCGGPCDKCSEGKACVEHNDCGEGLQCKPDERICSSQPIGDDDIDGIMDDVDQCLGTPLEEPVDEEGCSDSQKYSLGDDINDKWRNDYFGCIECPEAAPNADPDGDGLTNLQEYNAGTNPTNKDTDGDGWKDGVELEKGTDPKNPASHPPSTLLAFLKVLFVLLAIAGIAYGTYIVLQKRKPHAKSEEKAEHKKEEKLTAKEEILKLKQFAKQQEIPDKEWISLEKTIKKKPLSEKKFHQALEKLKKIATKETEKGTALEKLRSILNELESTERKDLLRKYKLLLEGKLTKEEMEELFAKLKITAEYYKEHKEQLQKELEHYGKNR